MSDLSEKRQPLNRAWVGPRALEGLETVLASAPPRLDLDARGLQRADAYTGAVVKEGIDRHLSADPGHTVILREPRNAETHGVLSDLLSPLPRRANWAGELPAAPRNPMVLLPADRIVNRESVDLLTFGLQAALGPRRLPESEKRLVLEAAKTVAFNDLAHRDRAATPGLQCVCQMAQSHDLQVVALSSRASDRCLETPDEFIDHLKIACSNPLSGLGGLVWRSRGDGRLDATLRIRAGRVRIRAREGRVRRAEIVENAVPWFAVGFEVHLGGRERR